MNKNSIIFRKDEIENMAKFIAEIIRQGIVFITVEEVTSYRIEFTGGF